MRTIEQRVELLAALDNSAFLIERAGRTCYKSEVEDCKKCDGGGVTIINGKYAQPCSECEKRAAKFIKKIVKLGHESVLEHASATLKFVTDRGITHELVRHRLCAYSQESTRYCNYGGKDIAGIDVSEIAPEGHQKGFERILKFAEEEYNHQIAAGIHPQWARRVLPIGLKTEIIHTANFRQWRHILKLRAINKRAHPQIRSLMKDALRLLVSICPAAFEDIMMSEWTKLTV